MRSSRYLRFGQFVAKFACFGGLIWSAVSSMAAEPTIRAAGIDGALVLCAAPLPSDESLDAFWELAGGKQADIAVLEWLSPGEPVAAEERGTRRLFQFWEQRGGRRLVVHRLSANADVDEVTLATLRSARGVWLEARQSSQLYERCASGPLADALRAVRQRGGVLGGSAALTAIAFDTVPVEIVKKLPHAKGLGWLPGISLDVAAAGSAADAPAAGTVREATTEAPSTDSAAVALHLESSATLVVHERLLRVVGKGSARARFPATHALAEEVFVLEGRQNLADLTAWRRHAEARRRDPYPSADLVPPHVEHGTLIIIGGGGTPKAAFEQFVERAGGAKASIVVLPVAMPDPLPPQDGMVEALKKAGVTDVTLLTARTPQEIDRLESLAALRRATGVWFGGGRQWRFIDAYEGAEAERLIHDVLRRGGVIAGSSAGASIQGDFLVRGHPLGSQFMICPGYERGMSFLPGVAIDQHFTQRSRHNDLKGLLRRYPQFLGIGLDESTAIVVRGSVAQVVGRHHAHFFDTCRTDDSGAPHMDAVSDGGRYDLSLRRVVEASSREAAPAAAAEAATPSGPTSASSSAIR